MRHFKVTIWHDLTWKQLDSMSKIYYKSKPPKTPQKRPKRAFWGVLGRFLGVFGRLMRVQKMRPDLTCWPEIHCFRSGQVNFIWKSHLSGGPWYVSASRQRKHRGDWVIGVFLGFFWIGATGRLVVFRKVTQNQPKYTSILNFWYQNRSTEYICPLTPHEYIMSDPFRLPSDA